MTMVLATPRPTARTPLAAVTSLKVKLSIVIVAAVAVAATTSSVGLRLGWPIWIRPVLAGLVSLVMVHFIARGMTSPLRAIDSAARRLSTGDYSARAPVSTNDEIGRLSNTFNSMAEELQRTELLRRRFVADAAHELRTPVAGVLATVENMADGITEVSPDELDRLHQQCRRLSALTGDLLDLSRLESGTLGLHLETIDLLALADAAATDARVRHPDVEITISGEVETVTGDRRHLRRALDNLVENASVHARHEDARTRIGIMVGPGPTISVTDDGPGLGDTADEIFDRFRRTPHSNGAGTGLGLAITREIVHLHNGSVRALDTSDGAIFVVTLPSSAATPH